MKQHESPRSSFGIRFSLLARRWRRVLDTHLAHAGLSGATWPPLIHLKQTGGGMTQKDLASLIGVDGSSLVRVLDILERQGLIERRRSESDGRARLVFLTLEGERRVAAISRELAKGEQTLLAGLSESELDAMLSSFDVIDQRISEFEHILSGEVASDAKTEHHDPSL